MVYPNHHHHTAPHEVVRGGGGQGELRVSSPYMNCKNFIVAYFFIIIINIPSMKLEFLLLGLKLLERGNLQGGYARIYII
jgi:hypothetical protein